MPDPADARAVQATQNESCRTGTGLGSNQQAVHDQADTRLGSDQQEVSVSAGTGIAHAAQDENRKRNTNSKLIRSNQQEVPVEPTADTENKPDTGPTTEVNMEINTDDRTDQTTTDSSKSAGDTSDNRVPNVAANRNSDAPHRSVDETCEELYIKDSGSDPHKLHALNNDNEDGGERERARNHRS